MHHAYPRTQASAVTRQALSLPCGNVGLMPGGEAQVEAGAVLRVVDDEAVALAVLGLSVANWRFRRDGRQPGRGEQLVYHHH